MKKLAASNRLAFAWMLSIPTGSFLCFSGGWAAAFGVIFLLLGVAFLVWHRSYSRRPKCKKLMIWRYGARRCQYCGEQVFE